MTTTDLAPAVPSPSSGVLDDPELAGDSARPTVRTRTCSCRCREFAASLDAYKDAARNGSPDAVGVMVDDELMTMPIYRGDWASSRAVHIDGVESVLHNERLIEAAQQVFDAEVVRPLIVFSNLTAPDAAEPQAHRRAHVPRRRAFAVPRRGSSARWPTSGLFERWRVKVATAVAWYYDGPNGGFSYWPDGGAAPEVTIEPPSNTAVVGDNDFMYHRVEAVGDGRFAMVPIDSLLSFDAAARRWRITKGDRDFGDFGRDDIRISISWKAECFHDAEEARVFDEHLDDITFDQVLATWQADCAARGIVLPDVADPLHDRAFEAAVAAAYAGPLSTA